MKPVKTKKIVHQQNRVKQSSRMLVLNECFAGRTKFYCGRYAARKPHVRQSSPLH